MANGIANNEKKEKKSKSSKPADQNAHTNICVSSFANTPDRGITGFKGKSVGDKLKTQIKNGEYIAIKLSDKPLQIESQKEEQR